MFAKQACRARIRSSNLVSISAAARIRNAGNVTQQQPKLCNSRALPELCSSLVGQQPQSTAPELRAVQQLQVHRESRGRAPHRWPNNNNIDDIVLYDVAFAHCCIFLWTLRHLYCAPSSSCRSTARCANSGASSMAASTSCCLRPRDAAMPCSNTGTTIWLRQPVQPFQLRAPLLSWISCISRKRQAAAAQCPVARKRKSLRVLRLQHLS